MQPGSGINAPGRIAQSSRRSAVVQRSSLNEKAPYPGRPGGCRHGFEIIVGTDMQMRIKPKQRPTLTFLLS